MNIKTFSLHWENVDPSIPYYQKKVMDHWQMPISQHCITGFDHGEWINWVLNRTEDANVVVFMDVDCIILDKDKAVGYIEQSADGILVGNEQATNHLGEDVASRVFAAPSFLAVNRHTWEWLGKPTAKATQFSDVAQNLTDVWQMRGVPVDLLRVSGCEVPKWDLPNKPQAFGIGTTYEDATYHLFESRTQENIDRFVNKCKEILNEI